MPKGKKKSTPKPKISGSGLVGSVYRPDMRKWVMWAWEQGIIGSNHFTLRGKRIRMSSDKVVTDVGEPVSDGVSASPDVVGDSVDD